VTRGLKEQSFTVRAKALQQELAGLDAPRRAADLLEEITGVQPQSLARSA
jgi:hypothetical protein